MTTPGPDTSDTNAWLFFRRWLANPREMGSVVPSSPALKRRITAEIVCGPDEVVVELGGGTGAVTQGILERGIPPGRLFVVEINPEMADHLRGLYPRVTVLQGDARKLDDLLPAGVIGRVGTVVCGIPMVLLPFEAQKPIVESAFRVMPPGRRLVMYTYALTSPLPARRLGLAGRRVAFVTANVPPASVWAYRQVGTR